MLKWYEKVGKNDDVVLQTRIRLARNFAEYPFAGRITDEDAKKLVNQVVGCFQAESPKEYDCYYMNQCDKNRKKALKEKQLISSYLLKYKEGASLVSADEACAIMLHAEDHVRIQVLGSGMSMPSCYKQANDVDDFIDSHFAYAFDEKLGYKTTFPTNVGTGLRASYTLHLPALSDAKRLQQIHTELARFGLKFKSVYGDGDKNYGHLYQIATQRTLGVKEREIIKDLDDIVLQLVKQEREQRQYFYERDKLQMEDEIYKSYGVLRYARKLSLKDAMVLFSEIMLGRSLGILTFDEKERFAPNRLIMEIQPALIRMQAGHDISVGESDVIRADLLRKNLPELM